MKLSDIEAEMEKSYKDAHAAAVTNLGLPATEEEIKEWQTYFEKIVVPCVKKCASEFLIRTRFDILWFFEGHMPGLFKNNGCTIPYLQKRLEVFRDHREILTRFHALYRLAVETIKKHIIETIEKAWNHEIHKVVHEIGNMIILEVEWPELFDKGAKLKQSYERLAEQVDDGVSKKRRVTEISEERWGEFFALAETEAEKEPIFGFMYDTSNESGYPFYPPIGYHVEKIPEIYKKWAGNNNAKWICRLEGCKLYWSKK